MYYKGGFLVIKKFADVFVVLTVVCLVALSGRIVLSRGEYMRYFFFHDVSDTGMDFFNSLAEASNGKPYESYYSSYPPASQSTYSCMNLAVPDSIRASIPESHHDVISLRGTRLDLRTLQSPMIIFILQNVCACLLLVSVVYYKFRSCGFLSIALAAASLFSYGCLYAFERGNNILFAMILTMTFLFGCDSESPRTRIISHIALVIAASVKLYPAAFGIMLFDGKRRGKALIYPVCCTAGMAIGISLISLQFFGGLGTLPLYLHCLAGFNNSESGDIVYRYGLRGITEHAFLLLYRHTGVFLPDHGMICHIALIASMLILILSIYYHRRHSEPPYLVAFNISLMITLVQPQSTDYTLCFFVPVLLMQIHDFRKISSVYIVHFILTLAFVLPYPTSAISDADNAVLRHTDVIQCLLLVSVGYKLVYTICGMLRHSNASAFSKPRHS